MVKLMGEQLFERYAKLWNKYGMKKFSFEDVKRTINEKDDNLINVVIHRLKIEEVIKITRNTEDKRTKMYHLISPVLWVQKKLKEIK